MLAKSAPRLRISRLQPPPTGAVFRRALSQVRAINEPFHEIDVDHFRRATDQLTRPVVLRRPPGADASSSSPAFLPAQAKWFADDPRRPGVGAGAGAGCSLAAYLADDFSHLPFPYELMGPQPTDRGQDAISLFLAWVSEGTSPRERLLHAVLAPLRDALLPASPPADSPPAGAAVAAAPTFHRLHAPLSLLTSALAFNATHPAHPLRTLYIAQSPISDLPAPLSADLPTPRLVRRAGRGDVYASSIWMGLEPTYTPLHRDPNPNLFVQLRGAKVIRLLDPRRGEALYREVRSAAAGTGSGAGGSRLRGADMMSGPERDLMHERVWAGGAEDVLEARVGEGDAAYVPLGWWHSVRSDGEEGALNASVNWWFR